MRAKQASLWLAWLALLAAPAHAVDGVREINQTCAETTGCFVGDSPGFPVTITLQGAYRLTSNLQLASAHAVGIAIATGYVSIDLNGFAIRGITDCIEVPACSNPGTGKGVTVTGGALSGLSVRNGTVSGMGLYGIEVGQHSQVKDVRVLSNGGHGIVAGLGSEIVGCNVARNGGAGITTSPASLVADNVVLVTLGSSTGINVGGNGVVRGNIVEDAGGDGIHAGATTLVEGNTVTFSGGDGIEVGAQSRVAGNTLYFNGGFGLNITAAPTGYANNMISTAFGNPTVTGGIDLGGNLCDGTPCP